MSRLLAQSYLHGRGCNQSFLALEHPLNREKIMLGSTSPRFVHKDQPQLIFALSTGSYVVVEGNISHVPCYTSYTNQVPRVYSFKYVMNELK